MAQYVERHTGSAAGAREREGAGSGTLRAAWAEAECAMSAGTFLLPPLMGTAVVCVVLGSWLDGGVAVGVGTGLGLAAWVVICATFMRRATRAATANPSVHGQLSVRLRSLDAQLAPLHPDGPLQATALAEAGEQQRLLHRDLGGERRAPGGGGGPCTRWTTGAGYIAMWNALHRAEEALIEAAPREAVFRGALQDARRLEGADVPMAEAHRQFLSGHLGVRADRPPGRNLLRFDESAVRACLREIRAEINGYRDERRERLVRRRNAVLFLVFLTGLAAYGVLSLAVLASADREAVVAGAAFYLTGAAVGLFDQLYRSRGREVLKVEDYGLANARLLATPLLSGIAGVAGVALQGIAGVIAVDAANGTTAFPPLEDVYSLSTNTAGLLVAAIFGLTPSLFLSRLRAQTERYEREMAETEAAG